MLEIVDQFFNFIIDLIVGFLNSIFLNKHIIIYNRTYILRGFYAFFLIVIITFIYDLIVIFSTEDRPKKQRKKKKLLYLQR